MCIFCVRAENDRTITSRERALQLLARLERPHGLRRDAALCLGARLLAWTEGAHPRFRCEAAVPGASTDRALSDEGPA